MGSACSQVGKYIPGAPKIPTVPDVPVDDIRKCAQEMLETFAPLYSKALPIEMVKAELNKLLELSVKPIVFELKVPAQMSTPIKEGWVQIAQNGMRGKSWEKRYLVIMNKSQNFAACLYEKDSQKTDMTKATVVQLDGYKVKEYNEEEQKTHGEHTLLVSSPAKTRKKLTIQLENAEARSAWESALKYAAKRAVPISNSDEVMQAAFYKAYTQTRSQFGDIGPEERTAGTEKQHLSALVCAKVDVDIMTKVYDTIEEGKAKDWIEDKIRDIVDKTIGAAVETAWKAAEAAIAKVKAKVDAALEKILKPIGELYKTIMTKLGELANVVLQQAIDKIAKPLLDSFATSLVEPTVQSFNACYRAWNDSMARTCSIDNARELSNTASSTWLMGTTWKYMWDFSRSAKTPTNADLTILNTQLEQMTSDLVINASATLEDTKDTPQQAWVATGVLLVNDCKKAAQKFYLDMLYYLIYTPLKNHVVPHIKDGVDKLQELIQADFKEFVDLTNIVDQFIQKQVRECVDKMGTPKIADAVHKIGATK